MADDPARPSVVHVLHIRADAPCGGSTDNVDTLLDSPSFLAQSCADVYRGLALVSSSRSPAISAIVVCVDGMTNAELEFFSIATRVASTIPILAYGAERYAHRVQAALEAGATSVATAEAIRALIPNDSATSQAGELTHEDRQPPDAAHQDPDHAIPTVEQDDSESSELPPADDNENPRPIRVPWGQYDRAPARSAPTEPSPPRNGPTAAPSTPTKRKSPLRGPLLTSEELQALIGDDISAIAPDEVDASEPGTALDEGKSA